MQNMMKLKNGSHGRKKGPTLRRNKSRRVLDKMGFERCLADPAVYRRAGDMDLTVHVNDMTLSGEYVLIWETLKIP